MKKIGFVTPWFGEKISGGAESALRDIAVHLMKANVPVEILTTCVKEFSSDWNHNYYKQGSYQELGMTVRRFEVRTRDTSAFDAINSKFINNIPVTKDEEQIFLQEMINSPKLYSYMESTKENYSVFVFMPYMFGTTYYGCQICPEKSILIPCFHEESYVYMSKFKEVFSKIAGMIFLSDPERQLAEKIFNLSNVQLEVIGTGIDINRIIQKDLFMDKFQLTSPFILYAGRKDVGKNVNTLLKYFAQYKKRKTDSDLKLVLIGGGEISIPVSVKEDVYDLGFVDIEDKYNACAAAAMLCQPSPHESFSIVMMESWLCKRPVIVSDACEVTKNFAKVSKGGLYFKDYFEFEGCVDYLLNHSEIADQMGSNGRNFVLSNFKWDVIVDKYNSFFEKVAEKAQQIKKDQSTEPVAKNSEHIPKINSRKKKIALVNQRYGLEVNGGSELHCRQLAEKLKDRYDVEVLTTCALDYITWDNYYREGIEEINGITVRRFKVDKQRDIKQFNHLSEIVLTNKDHTDAEEEAWIDEQGPYCPAFLEYLDRHYDDYDAVIFMTYLYYLTARGIIKHRNHSYLLPTAHDEPPIYLRYYQKVFQAPKGIIYNTEEEKRFLVDKFQIGSKPSIVAGVGVDLPDLNHLPDARKILGFEEDYILYIGRIDESKGCGTLFQYFKQYKKRTNRRIKLVLAGKTVMNIPEDKDIISLGFIEDDLKFSLIKNSKLLVLASAFESLSMVVLESMIMGRPVLVNGNCNVLKGHCVRSGAGLYFNNYFEFEGGLNYLFTHKKEYKIMCDNAKKYVEKNYQWEKIVKDVINILGV